ncbi:uncharacterized protein LOC134812879 isoform X2 [Bolinopsis microptera]|uniref:uncharacterized protein LOC134812879 isoform X2 n=1 Tax=Bolinopsis microptera TaxID=2820187 RepID=UPI003078EBF9
MTITIFILTTLLSWSSVKGGLPVEHDVEIEWDLESTPLEIRTDSVLGSDDEVMVYFLSAEGENAGLVQLYFYSTPQYYIDWCSREETNLVILPSDTVKVWRITLTRTAGVRLVIHCNDEEVLNILLSQSTCGPPDWSTVWNRDVTKIKFSSSDTASDYYGTQLQLPGELPVERDVKIDWDLESTPLEIRTDAVLGSNDQVAVTLYSGDEFAGSVVLYFTSTLQWSLGWCESAFADIVNPPSATDNLVWRISITRTAGVNLVIHCNNEEVVNTVVSELTCSNSAWSTTWIRDVTKIKFSSSDTASDNYGTQLQLPEDTSEEEDVSEQGDNQNYSDAAALKVSLIFLVNLLFAVNMNI